jgi:uncharacterized protein YbaR (Trm112 family)
MVSQDLLEILRCPVCVHNEPEGGELLYQGNWLICQDCDRKYPIRDDIPVMLIDEGDRFREIPADELPEVPPPEKAELAPTTAPAGAGSRKDMLPYLLLGGAGLLFGLFLVWIVCKRVCKR